MAQRTMKTVDCLKDLVRRHEGDVAFRHAMSLLLGVNRDHTLQWFKHGMVPKGENLLRLRVFLEVCGYKVKELNSLEPHLRRLAILLGLQLTSLDHVVEETGLERDSVLRVVLGRCGTSKQTKARIIALLEHSMEEHAFETVQEWRVRVGLPPLEHPVLPEEPKIIQPEWSAKAELTDAHARLQVVFSLSILVRAVLPLAELVASDTFTSEDRRELHKLASPDGDDVVFRTSTAFNRLCGEKAKKLLDRANEIAAKGGES